MIENNLIEFASRESNADPLTELLRQGARQLIAKAVEAELAVFMSAFAERQCPNGRAAVVRNGYQPERQIQKRCWVHKTANVLNCVPKSVQPKVKDALHQIWQAETQRDAHQAFDHFEALFSAKYPKAVQCLQKDLDELLAFYEFPAMHWQSLRTTNPIESTFSTVRHRTKRAKGCLSRDGMLQMMFKLGQGAEQNWRRLRGFEDLNKVITGVKFKDGVEIKQNAA